MKRTVRTWILATVLILAFSGCAIGYQASNFLGQGYSSRSVDDNTWTVTFRGNALNSLESVEAYAMQQCADVTLAAGYSYFTVLSHNVTPEIDPVAKGIQHVATIMIRGYRGSKPAGALDAKEVLRYQGRNQNLTPPPSEAKPEPPPCGLKDGFRDLVWGATLDSTFTLVPGGDDEPEVRAYSRVGDRLTIGTASISGVTYLFFQGRFFGVKAIAPSDQLSALTENLSKVWGAGDSSGKGPIKWGCVPVGKESETRAALFSEAKGLVLYIVDGKTLGQIQKRKKSGAGKDL
jgi:hypothetical protein